MNFSKVVKYLLTSKDDHFLYLTLQNYIRFKWIIWILLFNKNYRSCRIYRKSHSYHKNIVVIGLKYYGRNVKRRTNGFAKDFLKDNIKQSHHCPYCNVSLNNDNITADHIIPVSKGGNNTKVNLLACCKSCNEERGDEEFYTYLHQKQAKYKNIKYPFI